jgi:hypothetical protein
MSNKSSNQLINELKQDLYGIKKPVAPKQEVKKEKMSLMEMVFNAPNEMEADNPGYDTATLPNEPVDTPDAQPQAQPQGGDDMTPIQGQVPSEQVNDPEIKSILSNIRLAVIKGLAKLAEKPETVEYDTLKKILGIVDKPIETQAKANGLK